MDRKTARQVELAAIVVAGIVGATVVPFAVLIDSWNAIGAALIGSCLLVPAYIGWIIWFVVRGRS